MRKLISKIAGTLLGLSLGLGVCASFVFGSKPAKNVLADNVTLAYSAGTTTNMTGNNDAATLGLDASKWSVVGAKGGNSNFPGLNKNNYIALYYNATASNTLTVTNLDGNTITSISITWNGTFSNGVVKVGGAAVTGTSGTYSINSTSFLVTNGNTSNVQVQIKSIVINYSTSAATSLDAITSIGGTVSASVSKAGTYDWDFSNITVNGTVSGSSNQNVTDYVDLSSTTAIPSAIGACTVSVTATKKSTVTGSATSLTNPSISGDVGAAKLSYTFTMTQEVMIQKSGSYALENNNPKSSTATCTDHDPIEIAWASNQVQKNGTDMQFQTTNGYLYNTTEIPGTLVSVVVTATAQSFTVYYGNSEHPTSGTTPGGKYFTVQGVGSTPKASQVLVTFEVSDKPQVQLYATNINLDITDGAATPTVTDGTAAVSGYHLTSDDDYVASITGDGKVQPTGYGKVSISVTKDEDSGHVYLAGSFIVTVGDSSKQASIMEFTAKASDAEANRTSDDGVVWTITANQSENDFSDVYGINYGTAKNTVTSLVLSAPANEQRIIKNVVVEATSATAGSTISVSVGETALSISKSNSLTGSVSTFNFSGNTSGAITITISGTASSKYGVKSIAVLYVGDQATSFASTFLGAISCNDKGTSKPTFNIKSGETHWTWALLEAEYNGLGDTDKAKFAPGATGVSSTISACVARYDYIVGKYFKGGLDTTLISSDFMSRNPAPIVGANAVTTNYNNNNNSSTVIIVVVALTSITSIGVLLVIKRKRSLVK